MGTDLDKARAHDPRLVLIEHLREDVHGGKFNASIAVSATSLLSSMWFFWFCVVLDVIAVTLALTGKIPVLLLLVTIISQTIIQLLALPLLGASQNIIQAAQDAKALVDHETLMALKQINERQLQILEALHKSSGSPDSP